MISSKRVSGRNETQDGGPAAGIRKEQSNKRKKSVTEKNVGMSQQGSEHKANERSAFRVDHDRIERAVREILVAVGEDPDREGLLETPARVARMYAEIFSGLHKDPSIQEIIVWYQRSHSRTRHIAVCLLDQVNPHRTSPMRF